MAGHSKWANIKHRKARQDAKRSKAWSKIGRAMIMAVKSGGPDPDMNLTLRYAMDEARAENMPKDTMMGIIKKAAGAGQGDDYESLVYEGYGPAGVAVLLEILTDNRNRTAGEIRKIFERGGGNLGTSGCVAYIFQSVGQVTVAKDGVDEDALMEAALEAGADDVADLEDAWQVVCDPSSLEDVRKAIEGAGFAVQSAGRTMEPNTSVTVAGDDARKTLNLLDALEDHDDVQKVYANFDVPDEEMAALEVE